jgi:hypothetical protein
MPSYIQIAGDPAKWWLTQPVDASQLSGQPLNISVAAPMAGFLVVSGKVASTAIFNEPSATIPGDINGPEAAIYLPTATGPSAGHTGYALPPTVDVANLASQIETSMRNGSHQTITLDGGGTLVLNGATLSFVVIQPGAIGDSSAHG